MAETIRSDGPTPNGGAYAIITFLDMDDNLADQAVADKFELVEYDALNSQVFRTYGLMSHSSATPNTGDQLNV